MKILKKTIYFFDKLEDHFRIALSRRPMFYAIVGGIGLVLFYRGVWMIADLFVFMNGIVSAVVGLIILMAVGLMISTFVGDSIIISGLKKEATKIEKIKKEVEEEELEIKRIRIKKGRK
jgi:hypothetical protein